MSDQNNIDDNSQDSSQDSYYFIVRHNDQIVGSYGTEEEANDAMGGYQLSNQIQLEDTMEILKIAQ